MSAITSLSSRAWAGPDDLRAMTGVVSKAWASPRRPLVPCTVGDLEWWTASGGPDADWPSRAGIWELGGTVVGWGWLNRPASLDWFVVDGLTATEDAAVRDGILDWLADYGRASRAADPAADPAAAGLTPEPSAAGAIAEPAAQRNAVELEAWAPDDWPEQAALVSRGWTPTEVVITQFVQALDVELDPPRVPEGYVLRSLRGPQDVPARVEVHRAAFAPSKMTVEKYAILRAQDHYAFDRDIVLESADGTFAAFTMCWLDPLGSIGEFEPVGTHPDHQRRGLGRVIMRHGLRLMRAAGLRDALVFSLRSNVASEALYRSAGFDEVALHRRYTKPLEP
jgi:ribosomal protein S18 acetylase RimI-like enzyme